MFATASYDHGIPYTQRFDPDYTTPTYVGQADPGTATSEAKWRIYKIQSSLISWASGSTKFDQIWDNRASLTYS